MLFKALLLPALLLFGCVAYTPSDFETPTPAPAHVAPTATPRPATTVVAQSQPTAAAEPSPATTPPASVPPDCLVARPRPGVTPAPQDLVSPGVRLVAAAGVPPAPGFAPSPLQTDPALEAVLLAALGEDRDSYAFYVKDLNSGRGAAFNPGRVFYSASLFKLWVMYEVFHQIEAGLFDLDTRLVMTPYYDAFGLGPRKTSLCQSLDVAAALDAMLSLSDNAAAVLLQDLVGAGNINAALAALGVRDSALLSDDLPLTAQDVALLLEAIGRGQAISAEASRQMADLMSREAFDNGLRAGLPAGVPLAHKTGNWTNATHDGGIVSADFTTYVIVVLSDRDHVTEPTRRVAAAAYEYLRSLYER